MANKSTKKGSKVYVCETAQNSDLTASTYAALTWVQVGKVGNIGDFGSDSTINIQYAGRAGAAEAEGRFQRGRSGA